MWLYRDDVSVVSSADYVIRSTTSNIKENQGRTVNDNDIKCSDCYNSHCMMNKRYMEKSKHIFYIHKYNMKKLRVE